MFKLFKQIPLYIKISTDKIEIRNLKTGDTRSDVAPFSTSRIVVSSFNNAEILMRSLLQDLEVAGSQLKVVIQQIENVEGGLSEIEKRAMRDLGEQAGCYFVILVEHTRPLSDEEALLLLKKK